LPGNVGTPCPLDPPPVIAIEPFGAPAELQVPQFRAINRSRSNSVCASESAFRSPARFAASRPEPVASSETGQKNRLASLLVNRQGPVPSQNKIFSRSALRPGTQTGVPRTGARCLQPASSTCIEGAAPSTITGIDSGVAGGSSAGYVGGLHGRKSRFFRVGPECLLLSEQNPRGNPIASCRSEDR
jgi:hypothetical protein